MVSFSVFVRLFFLENVWEDSILEATISCGYPENTELVCKIIVSFSYVQVFDVSLRSLLPKC